MKKFAVYLASGEDIEVEAVDSQAARLAVEATYENVEVTAVVEVIDGEDDTNQEEET